MQKKQKLHLFIMTDFIDMHTKASCVGWAHVELLLTK